MAFSIADAARPTLLCEATESPRGENMKRNVVVAAFLAAVLIVIPLPSRGQRVELYANGLITAQASMKERTFSFLRADADLAVGGLIKNKKGGVGDFLGTDKGDPPAKPRNLDDWVRRDAGPVPGAGWEKLKKQDGAKYAGHMPLTDKASNTYTHSRAGWISKTYNEEGFTKIDFTGRVGADVSAIDETKDYQGPVRAAALVADPVVFRVRDETPFTLKVEIGADLLARRGAGRFAEVNWFAAWGSGTVVGENIIDGTMRKEALIIEDKSRAGEAVILELEEKLAPGDYWYSFGTSSIVGAVPEPATLLILGPAAAALVARRSRRRR
jgi:hypothetical protein